MARSKKPIPLTDLQLPTALERKLLENFPDTGRLRVLKPVVLIKEWGITEKQWQRINAALLSRGQEPLGDYEVPEKKTRALSLTGKCRKTVDIPIEGVVDGQVTYGHGPCARPLLEGKRSCLWHWLADQPIELQTEWADQRRRIAERAAGFVERARVPEREWPEGHRWCSECQTMIPLFYCRGSRCIPHASRAAHASMMKRVYDFTREDYEALLAWQKGRCYICQQVPRAKRLAVDHDHATGAVRGLLCANDEWGCNSTLRRLLNSKGMAQRALDYVTKTPLERMQAGEDSPVIDQRRRPATMTEVAERLTTRVHQPPRGGDPFAGF